MNEEDASPLHVLPVLLDLGRLIKRRKVAFTVTRRGEELLAEAREVPGKWPNFTDHE